MVTRRVLSALLLGVTVSQICIGIVVATFVATLARPSSGSAAAVSHSIAVGPGFSDVSPRQLVRTSANVLYTVVPDCPLYPCAGTGYTGPPNALHTYRATTPGIPAGFSEADSAHHPTGNIGTAAVAIDGRDVIHVVWLTTNGTGNVFYAPFNTATDTWGGATTLATTNWTDWNNTIEGVALAVDAAGVPTVVYNSKESDGILHLWVANAATGWQASRLDDVPLATNAKPQHPAMAFTSTGDLVVAYMVGTFNYTPDGSIYVRTRAGGAWGPSVRIAEGAMTTIDNGPSLLITPDGTQHLTFLNTNDEIRYWYNGGAGWLGDRQPPTQQTHDPALGPDGSGGIYIYGHGAPVGNIQGHGDNLYSFHKGAGGQWEPWTLYASGSYDCSVSPRWSQFFNYFPQSVDIAYWSDIEPYTLYVGTDIIASTPGPNPIPGARPSVPPETVPPNQLPPPRLNNILLSGTPPNPLPPRR